MKKETAILLLFLSVFSGVVKGQYYNTGQDPASFKWEQTVTPHFRIIYPSDFSDRAFQYAILLEEAYARLAPLYPEKKIRIPVIIHSHSMESNGYVSWAPRRMEMYPLPGQDNLPMDPALQLTLHETAHIMQMASLNRGISKVLSFIAGEQAFGLSVLMVPAWALEGDAVYAETALTQSGRGRSNTFIQTARAMTLSPVGKYGFDKMVHGSFRDYTPDHYVFGYLMINDLQANNPGAWNEILKKAGSRLAEVNRGLKLNTGINEDRLYARSFDSIREKWLKSDLNTSHYKKLNIPNENVYTNHFSPFRIDEQRLVSLKTSPVSPPAFVITDTKENKEQVLTTTGYIYPYLFSYSNGTLVWAEHHADIRWENRDYSVIRVMDLNEGKIRQITRKTRYTAPDISPDGKTIVAAATTPEFRNSLVFLDATGGEKIMELAAPEGITFQRPLWSADGMAVTVVTLNENGEGVRTWFPQGKRWITNIPEESVDIIQARMAGDTLYYLSQGDGSDNIYTLSPDGIKRRITSSRFGISGFSISGQELLFSDYTHSGFIIAASGKDDFKVSDSVEVKEVLPHVADIFTPEDQSVIADTSLFITKPYRKVTHLFNIHSWLPVYANIQELQAGLSGSLYPGFTLLSQNHLSSLTSTIGYEYSGGSHFLHTGIQWSGWYPLIEADITYGGQQAYSVPQGVSDIPADLMTGMKLNVSISQPVSLSYGKFRQLFMPAIYINYSNNFIYNRSLSEYNEGITKITGQFYFHNLFRMAYRDIYPRWGQVLDLRLVSAPFDKDLYSKLRYVRSVFFLPGFSRNHSLMIRAGYETQAPSGELLYSNQTPYPRGYKNINSEKLFSLSADYTMPLFYPDLSIRSLFYLKRVRGSLFFDGATGWGISDYNTHTYREGPSDFGSFGGEMLADFSLLRFPFEISLGASGGYIPVEKRGFIVPVLYVNIYGNTLGSNR